MSLTVTLAVPCYNGEPFIARTIEALLAQTRQAEEILILDDGSTDSTAQIIQKYPVKFIQHPGNLGLSAGRNSLWKSTKTDWIVYIDADAFAAPDMLVELMRSVEQSKAQGVGGRGIEAVQVTLFDQWRSLHATQSHGNYPKYVEHLYGLCMGYPVSSLDAAGGFDTRLKTNAEDVDIGYRLTDLGHRLFYTPQAKVFHQRKDNRVTLQKMMYNWYYWAFLVKHKNKRNGWSLAVGTVNRMLWKDTLIDLFYRRSIALAQLDLTLSMVKFRAIIDASKAIQNLRW